MRRLVFAVILLVLLAGACGGSDPGDRGDYSPPALEQTGSTVEFTIS